MPVVAANGLEIGYDVVGAGPPAVWLHGATSLGADDFAAQLPLFSKSFRIYLPDARGHGRTRWDGADGFQHGWLADDLAAFVDAVGLHTFHLLGFSMGGMTALQYAVRSAARLRTLVVAGISPKREPRLSVGRKSMDVPTILRTDPAWVKVLARRHDAGQGIDAWQRLLPAIAADIAVHPLLEAHELHGIDVPTLVVCGDSDPWVPVDHALELRRQIPQASLFVAPDCGHVVMVRRPGLFNEALGVFYRATEAQARARTAAGSIEGGPE